MPRNGNASCAAIVKLGGSLAHTQQCAAWLEVLTAWGGPLILVPGGGPFADCVRTTQATMRFDDATAHRMALVAMEQYGTALAARAPVFALASCRDELDGALCAGQIPVWMPTKMILAAPEVPETWELTSDSLAAWLAGLLGAPPVAADQIRRSDGSGYGERPCGKQNRRSLVSTLCRAKPGGGLARGPIGTRGRVAHIARRRNAGDQNHNCLI